MEVILYGGLALVSFGVLALLVELFFVCWDHWTDDPSFPDGEG